MSQFTKSLEKRIQELTASIDAQKTELAAYERVLHMELSKGSEHAESPSAADEVLATSSEVMTPAPAKKAVKSGARATTAAPVKANKTTLVAEVVTSYGEEGASPKDIDAYFTAKNIQRSKNLVYNTLSYLVAQKKLTRRDGRYFANSSAPTVTAAKKRGPLPQAAKEPSTTKRRLSPEGLQRIKDALKKRWAAKRAAEAASKPAATKTVAKRATKKK